MKRNNLFIILAGFSDREMNKVEIVGFIGGKKFEDISEYFNSADVDVIVMDSMRVFGRNHVISAMEHAERSFRNGTNRSKTIITEFLLYMAGERQISRALSTMKPKSEQGGIVAVFPNGVSKSVLEGSGMKRDDSVIDGTEEKAKVIGLSKNGLDVSYEDLVLEMVAMADVMKS